MFCRGESRDVEDSGRGSLDVLIGSGVRYYVVRSFERRGIG